MGSPSLAEQWFVTDAVVGLSGLCPFCRNAFAKEIANFGSTPAEAFSEIYRMSRAIRIKKAMSGRISDAKSMDNWEALRVHRTLAALIGLAATGYVSLAPDLASGEAA